MHDREGTYVRAYVHRSKSKIDRPAISDRVMHGKS